MSDAKLNISETETSENTRSHWFEKYSKWALLLFALILFLFGGLIAYSHHYTNTYNNCKVEKLQSTKPNVKPSLYKVESSCGEFSVSKDLVGDSETVPELYQNGVFDFTARGLFGVKELTKAVEVK